MTSTPTVVAVSGSLRDGSYTRTALMYVLEAAEQAGAETRLLDLQEYDLPVYDPDLEGQGESETVTRIVREADAVVLGSPVYHGSYSGVLKNFHDYCTFEEYEKTIVGLLATAGGGSYGPTLEHLRSTVRGVHGWVLPHQVGIPDAYEQFEEDPEAPDGRRFVDPDLEARVEKLGRQLVAYAEIEPASNAEAAAADD